MPNLVGIHPVVLAPNPNKQTNKQTDRQASFIYIDSSYYNLSITFKSILFQASRVETYCDLLWTRWGWHHSGHCNSGQGLLQHLPLFEISLPESQDWLWLPSDFELFWKRFLRRLWVTTYWPPHCACNIRWACFVKSVCESYLVIQLFFSLIQDGTCDEGWTGNAQLGICFKRFDPEFQEDPINAEEAQDKCENMGEGKRIWGFAAHNYAPFRRFVPGRAPLSGASECYPGGGPGSWSRHRVLLPAVIHWAAQGWAGVSRVPVVLRLGATAGTTGGSCGCQANLIVLLRSALRRYFIPIVYQYTYDLTPTSLLCLLPSTFLKSKPQYFKPFSLSLHFPHSVLELMPMGTSWTFNVPCGLMSSMQSSASTSRTWRDLPKVTSGRLWGKAKKTYH